MVSNKIFQTANIHRYVDVGIDIDWTRGSINKQKTVMLKTNNDVNKD
jgi:hypothetical protein